MDHNPVWHNEEYEKRNPSGRGVKVTPDIIRETEIELGLRTEDGTGPMDAGLAVINEPARTKTTCCCDCHQAKRKQKSKQPFR